jgi:hypothetical protein
MPNRPKVRRQQQQPSAENVNAFVNWGFDWNDLVPVIRATAINTLPPVSTLMVCEGRYVADHISASRHLVAALWRSARGNGPIQVSPGSRRFEHLTYAASVHLARAEAAAQDASFWMIKAELRDDRAAQEFYRQKLEAIKGVSGELERAMGTLGQLDGLADEAPTRGGLRGDSPGPVLRDDAPKPKPTDGATGGDLVKDALNQVGQVLDGIKELVKKFDKPQKEGEITELIKAVASAIVGGGKAALVAAVSALLKSLDSDATPEDVDIERGPDGTVTIYFRVRKGCLIFLDWAVSDDYVFVQKGGKNGTYKFKTGKSAKEELEKANAKEGPKSAGSEPKPK